MEDHTPSLKELGSRIRRSRIGGGLSQEAFADYVGLDRSYLGGIERGERNISFFVLCQIASALECDLGRLMKGLPLCGSAGDVRPRSD